MKVTVLFRFRDRIILFLSLQEYVQGIVNILDLLEYIIILNLTNYNTCKRASQVWIVDYFLDWTALSNHDKIPLCKRWSRP